MNRILVTMVCLLLTGVTAAEEHTVKTFEDTGEALLNPDMGWVSYFVNYPTFDASDVNDDFSGCSTVYFRIPWSKLQPSENFIDWAQIDGPAQRWIAAGKKVALRFITSMAANNYCTPKWVFDAGAKSFKYDWNGREYLDPVFDDPIYLGKLENFLSEAGKRYGNNPNIAFIDIGTFGLWGEGHTLFTQKLTQQETDRIAEIHADLHIKYFPNTLLAISDDIIGHNVPGDDFPLLNRLRAKGITLRDDSILVNKTNPWYHDFLAQKYWRTLPVILEHDHLGGLLRQNAWDGARLLEAVEKYHASYMSIHFWTDIEKETLGDYLDRINRRLGYRIQIRQMDYPSEITPGVAFLAGFQLANVGVAPCHPGGFLALTLKNEKNEIVSVATADHFDVQSLTVGSPAAIPVKQVKCRFKFSKEAPDIAPGEYRLYVSVGDRMGTPTIALPLAGTDGARRYYAGNVKVRNRGDAVYSGMANRIWVNNNGRPLNHVSLVREFDLTDTPAKAILFASADVGTLYVNGRKMELALDRRGILKRYDLTALLKPGKNLLAISASSVNAHGIAADLRITDGKGNVQTLLSDGLWRGSGIVESGRESSPTASANWKAADIVEPGRLIGTRIPYEPGLE